MKKKCFVLEISRFLCFCETRVQNLWCHQKHCWIMQVTLMLIFFGSQFPSKWYLVKYQCAVWQAFLKYFWLNAGDWKLVPGFFKILLRWQYSKIWPLFNGRHMPFLINCPLFTFFKNIKRWNLDVFGYWVIGAGY